jgi:hypothetical protein
MIRDEERRVHTLQNQLTSAEVETPPDPIRIADLQRRINESRQSLGSLRQQMAQLRTIIEVLNMPGSIMPSPE